MASQTDHPLSVKGKEQAEALRDKLSSIAAEKIECAASAMLRPDAVYVSPLTRALQTAIIGLGQVILEPNGSGEIVLMANAREKQNFGGRDTRSKKIGSDILQRSLDELGVLYNAQSDVFKDFAKLRCDTSEVEDRWWTEGSRESDAQLQTRLWQFMSQLLYSPHRTIIVVGHSHFFRAVFKRFVSDEFKSQNLNFARDISTNKLMNCGVARLDLDPRRSLTGGPIVGIESVLGSELVKDKA